MSQIFHPAMNTLSRVSVFGGIIAVVSGVFAWDRFYRSAYVTEVDVVREQPVPFSHEHHVGRLEIDCRYCHTTVETAAFAGMPATEVCMSCHSLVWKDSPLLEPVRASLRTGEPLKWTRVHDLADFVYFNHSIHVSKGIGCESCHGRVDRMPLMRRTSSLHMSWCLDCHEHPQQHIRERKDVFRFGEASASAAPLDGRTLVREYHVDTRQLLDCGICHR